MAVRESAAGEVEKVSALAESKRLVRLYEALRWRNIRTGKVELRHCLLEDEFFALRDIWLQKQRRGYWIGDMKQLLPHGLSQDTFPSGSHLAPCFCFSLWFLKTQRDVGFSQKILGVNSLRYLVGLDDLHCISDLTIDYRYLTYDMNRY